MLSVVIALLVFGILTAFFYKTVKMDIAGAIISAVVSGGVLALLIAAAIYAGQIFG